jgi:hypothetical protein
MPATFTDELPGAPGSAHQTQNTNAFVNELTTPGFNWRPSVHMFTKPIADH